MLRSALKNILTLIIIVNAILSPTLSHANQNEGDVYDGVRDIGYDEDKNRCDTGNISPFDKKLRVTEDYNFNLSNDYCTAYASSWGARIGSAIIAKMVACPGIKLKRSKWPSFLWITNQFKGAQQCVKISSEAYSLATTCYNTGVSCPAAALKSTAATACCSSASQYTTTLAGATAELGTIYGVAENETNDVQICGKDWQTWRNEETDTSSKGVWINKKGPYQLCLDVLFLHDGNFEDAKKEHPDVYNIKFNNKNLKNYCKDKGYKWRYDEGEVRMVEDDGAVSNKAKERAISNQFYREFIYGGIEHMDKSCENPIADTDYFDRAFGYKSKGDNKYQRYYMTGPGENFSPNFACSRFSPRDVTKREAMKDSYNCCVQRAEETICLDHGDDADGKNIKFCQENTKCSVDGASVDIGSVNIDPKIISYKIYRSISNPQYLCAKSYSLCPYNFTVGLGTEFFESDNNGGYVNHCQYLNHCSKTSHYSAGYIPSFDGKGARYISSACQDMQGDSQFNYSFEIDVAPEQIRNFTAPIAQCFTETITNFLLNKAGNSKCSSAAEFPNRGGICASGNYEYQKGQYLSQDPSILEVIRDNLKNIIKISLVLAIVFFGIAMMLAMPKMPERKAIMIFVVKLAFVMYFVIGDAWQTIFIEGVLGSSHVMSNLTFRSYEGVYDEVIEERKNSALTNDIDYQNDKIALCGSDSEWNSLAICTIANDSGGVNGEYKTLLDAKSNLETQKSRIETEIEGLRQELVGAELALDNAEQNKIAEKDRISSLATSNLQNLIDSTSSLTAPNSQTLEIEIAAINTRISNFNNNNSPTASIPAIPEIPNLGSDAAAEEGNIILEAGVDKTSNTSGHIFDEGKNIAAAQSALEAAVANYNLEQEKLAIAQRQVALNAAVANATDPASAQEDVDDARDILHKRLINVAYIDRSAATNYIDSNLSGDDKSNATNAIEIGAYPLTRGAYGIDGYTQAVEGDLKKGHDFNNIIEYKTLIERDETVRHANISQGTSQWYYATKSLLRLTDATSMQVFIDYFMSDNTSCNIYDTDDTDDTIQEREACYYYDLIHPMQGNIIYRVGSLIILKDAIYDYENCVERSECVRLTSSTLSDLLGAGAGSLQEAKSELDNKKTVLETVLAAVQSAKAENDAEQAAIDQLIQGFVNNSPPATVENITDEINQIVAAIEQGTFTPANDPAPGQAVIDARSALLQQRENLLDNRISFFEDLSQYEEDLANYESQKAIDIADLISQIQDAARCYCKDNSINLGDDANAVISSIPTTLNCDSTLSTQTIANDCTNFDQLITDAQNNVTNIQCQIDDKQSGNSAIASCTITPTSSDPETCINIADCNAKIAAKQAEINDTTSYNGFSVAQEHARLNAALRAREALFESESRKIALKESEINGILDGCQFPRYNYQQMYNYNFDSKNRDGIDGSALSRIDMSQAASYPPGKEYLRIFDTLDCKIARALGFAPNVSVPNILLMIVGAFLTGGLGILFFVGALMFGFFMISIAFRALHLFIMSMIAMAVLIYVSPITITCALFTKTNDIFKKWYKSLMGVALQPMILFAYITMMIAVFDAVIIGDARFEDTNTSTAQQGAAIAQNPDEAAENIISGMEKKLDCEDRIGAGGEEIKPNETSIYCIFRINELQDLNGFEPLGVSIPILRNLNSVKIMTILKAALIMFVFMKFIDQISTLANKLVNGGLKESTISPGSMAQRTGKMLRGIQKRGARASQKLTKRAGSAIGDKVRSKGKRQALEQGGDHEGGISKSGGNHRAGISESGNNHQAGISESGGNHQAKIGESDDESRK